MEAWVCDRCDKTQMGELRQKGKSTVIALRAIAKAIAKPGHWVALVDHHNSPKADKFLLRLTHYYIEKLNLKHFQYRRTNQPGIRSMWVGLEVNEDGNHKPIIIGRCDG